MSNMNNKMEEELYYFLNGSGSKKVFSPLK